MTTYAVESRTVGIFPDGNGPSTSLYNAGNAVIYLGETTHTSVLDYPLNPTATVQWAAGRPLYATCGPGLSSTLGLNDGITNIFDPSAIAGQILNQGLATQIANAVFLQGIPPVDVPVSLASLNQATNAAVTFPVAPVDCSRYASLLVNFRAAYAVTQALPRPRCLTIEWLIGGIIVARDSATFSDDPAPLGTELGSRLWMPTKGTHFQVSIKAQNPSGPPIPVGQTHTVQVSVYGSYRTPDDADTYLNYTGFPAVAVANQDKRGSDGLDRYSHITFNAIPAFTTVTQYVNNYAGPTTLQFSNFSAQNLAWAIIETETLQRVVGGVELANTAVWRGPFNIPRRPVAFSVANNTGVAIGAGQVFLSLAQ